MNFAELARRLYFISFKQLVRKNQKRPVLYLQAALAVSADGTANAENMIISTSVPPATQLQFLIAMTVKLGLKPPQPVAPAPAPTDTGVPGTES